MKFVRSAVDLGKTDGFAHLLARKTFLNIELTFLEQRDDFIGLLAGQKLRSGKDRDSMGLWMLAAFVPQYPITFPICGAMYSQYCADAVDGLRTQFLPFPGYCRGVGAVTERRASMAFTDGRKMVRSQAVSSQ
ncbi:hypothetical protein [Variovorax boronicumulans]